MLETGFNRTEFGKGILGACFINDLGTVIALGLLFAPFNYKTVIFIAITVLVLAILPFTSRWITNIYANRTAAIRTKWVILILFGRGGHRQRGDTNNDCRNGLPAPSSFAETGTGCR